jgi:hypothetical protein
MSLMIFDASKDISIGFSVLLLNDNVLQIVKNWWTSLPGRMLDDILRWDDRTMEAVDGFADH